MVFAVDSCSAGIKADVEVDAGEGRKERAETDVKLKSSFISQLVPPQPAMTARQLRRSFCAVPRASLCISHLNKVSTAGHLVFLALSSDEAVQNVLFRQQFGGGLLQFPASRESSRKYNEACLCSEMASSAGEV